MNKERLMQLLILLGLIFIIIFSFLAHFILGDFYVLLILIIIVCGNIFIFIFLYLRIQHNIDRKYFGIKAHSERNFNEQKQIYEETVDFFRNLLNYLKDEKKNLEQIKFSLNNDFEKLNEFQNRIAVLIQQNLEYQKDKADFESMRKKKNDTRKKY